MATASDEELAAAAGFTVAFFRSNDELWGIFKKARKEQWTGDRLLSRLRNSDWFTDNSEAQRQATLLKESDPAEYERRRNEARGEVERIARSLNLSLTSSTRNNLVEMAAVHGWTGTQIENHLRSTKAFENRSESRREVERLKSENPAEYRNRYGKVRAEVQRIARETGMGRDGDWITQTAEMALLNNWTETQIRNHLAGFGDVASRVRKGKGLTGDAAASRRLVQQLSQDYGINMSKGTMANMVQKMAGGVWDENFAQDWFMRKAKQQYRNLADDIDAGLTVKQVAEPYIEAMSEILELNPSAVDVFDRDVRNALRNKGGLEDLADFENRMRNDPRWNRTHNARESMMTTGRDVLSKMGLMA